MRLEDFWEAENTKVAYYTMSASANCARDCLNGTRER